MSTHSLRKAIADAKRLESLTGTFELSLRQKKTQLHRAIQVPRQHSSDLLVEFVIDYIEHTVLLIESIQRQMRRLDLEEAIGPALETALAFFTAPPLPSHQPVTGTEPRLHQLMEQSFLAQRLLEEVGDLCALWHNKRLSSPENTPENLIIHQLIGENRANQLDTIANRLAQEYLPAIQQTRPAKRTPDAGESTANPAHPPLPPQPSASIRLTIGPPGSLIKYFWDQ